jgi:hypothetical protein
MQIDDVEAPSAWQLELREQERSIELDRLWLIVS